jgi:CRISPR-associated exonuclease Cas4
MFSEAELLPLSGLQHLLYCERQWALIHIERQWEENRLTAQGRSLHRTVDDTPSESRAGVRIVRSLPLRSLRLGISGKADVVEFPLSGGAPVPVEYKRGRPKLGLWDEVQLCAQAICLEEMLNVSIDEGALFYGAPRRRSIVTFAPGLRLRTEQAAARMHDLYERGTTPPPAYESRKCDRCSLIEICQPKALQDHASASAWLERAIRAASREPQERE